jgi:hypothetical protein
MNRCRSMAVARSRHHHVFSSPPRRGVALILVMGVILVAAVLGYAMLSHASLTQQVSANASQSAAAQGMAESGVNLAIYYLQNPEKWKEYPTAYPDTEKYDRDGKYWTGTKGQFVDFGSPSIGSVKVTVERTNPLVRWQYDVVATGRCAGSSLERTVNATVYLDAEYKIEHAAVFTNDVTLTGRDALRPARAGRRRRRVQQRRPGDPHGRQTVRSRASGARLCPAPSYPQAAGQSGPLVPKVVPLPAEIRTYQTYEYPKGTNNTAATLTGVTEIGSLLGIPVEKRGRHDE